LNMLSYYYNIIIYLHYLVNYKAHYAIVHWYSLSTIVGEGRIASGASEKKFGHYIAFW
jgi:hypothetical protein